MTFTIRFLFILLLAFVFAYNIVSSIEIKREVKR